MFKGGLSLSESSSRLTDARALTTVPKFGTEKLSFENRTCPSFVAFKLIFVIVNTSYNIIFLNFRVSTEFS